MGEDIGEYERSGNRYFHRMRTGEDTIGTGQEDAEGRHYLQGRESEDVRENACIAGIKKKEKSMSFFFFFLIGIAGIACAVPKNNVTVDSFIPVFGEEITSKFTSGTGIKAMYKALPEQTASDLAVAAAGNLFAHIDVDKKEIGLMIMVTQSPDYRRPSSASIVQKRLELPVECSCMEINLGCSGFIYGLQTAISMTCNWV